MAVPTITHVDINDMIKKIKNAAGDLPGEDLVVVVRPFVRFTDTAKYLLKHKGIEIIRSEAGPIDSIYLLDRATYERYKK